MASLETVQKVFAMVFFKFPSRRAANKEEGEIAFKVWADIYAPIPDADLMNAATRFYAETTKIYPDDDPFAIIRQIAAPALNETEGDAVELAFEAVSRFGRYQEAKAIAWLKEKSPLIAASVVRVGFQELCNSEEPDVIRGQLRAIFKAEKARSKEIGGIVESATHLEDGQANKDLLKIVDNLRIGMQLKPRKALPDANS